ncbi:serine hydrolase [Lacticaseibacillus baoqingensis]|uniref:serine-type D-Ala-D-Ala carboxypeptidase n=1 Tax=Lacticaseibacillus baoqingensis TaxID=2486013 RepID=A0ABW4E8P3_9LACO|nr:serine hydrolase [Lacticaseibacillus baoqingensis]
MANLWRSLIVAIASVSIWLGGAPSVMAHAATTDDIDASAALAIEAKTGKILYAKNADQALPIASMTKLIGIYLVRQAIAQGKLQWTTTVTPDANIYALSQDKQLSNVPLRQDGQYTIKALYQASLIYSANAAMMLLGNAVAGNQAKFIDQMRAQLKAWGISDATIINASGLDNNELAAVDRYPQTTDTDQNLLSAKDVAIVAQHLIADYPDTLATTSIKEMLFDSGNSDATKMANYNTMLPGLATAQSDFTVDGLKTGTTDRAGDCFAGTATQHGMRIITVVMHANGSGDDKRFVQTAKLMRTTFANWKLMTVATAGKAVPGHTQLAVKYGQQGTVPLVADKTLALYVPKATTAAQLQYSYQGQTKRVLAPIAKAHAVGTLTVAAKDDPLGYLNGQTAQTVTIKTAQTVKKANVFVLIMRGVGEYFGDLLAQWT